MNAVELVLFLLSELSSHSGKTKTYVLLEWGVFLVKKLRLYLV